MRKKFIVLFSFFLSSCTYFLQGQLEITVTSSNKIPVQDAQLNLYGKNRNKEVFIGYLYPNANGKVVTKIDFSKYQSLKIVTTSRSLEKILLPAIEYVSIPHWWQEQVLNLTINLPEIVMPSQSTAKTNNLNNDLSKVKELLPVPEVAVISQLESNLYESPLPKKGHKSNIFYNQITNIENKFNPIYKKTITEKEINYIQSYTFKVTAENKPIENAIIYTGYNATQTIKKEGATNFSGEIKINYNKMSPPDIVIIKKQGYVTYVSPFTSNLNNQSLAFEIKLGQSYDFLIQNYAYGIGRGFEKTELLLNGVKQDISSALGFISFPKEIKQEDFLSIEQKNSILTNISADDLKKQMQIQKDNITTLYLPALTPFKPTVGFIEPNLLGTLESNKLWRRARREFFSRFINEQNFKTKIQDDLIKITNAKNNALIDFFKKDWRNESYAKDIDLLIQVDFIENGTEPTMVARVYAKNGQMITEQKKALNQENAEQISSQIYNYIMAQLPIEAYIIQQEKGVFTLNVGKKQHINKGDLFIAFIPKSFYSIPDNPIGVLKVTDVNDSEAKANAIIGHDKLQSNIHIRVERSSQNLIDNEMKKHLVGYF